MATSSFMSIPALIGDSDRLAVAPLGLAAALADKLAPIRIPDALALPTVDLFLTWHARNHSEPLHQWVRGQLASYWHENGQ